MKRKTGFMSTKDMIEEYLVDCKSRGLSERTVEGYRHDLTLLVGNDTTVTESCVQRLLGRSESLSLNSVNHYIRCLKTFVKWASDMGYMEPFDIPTVRGQKPVLKMYSDEDLKKLLDINLKTASFVEHRTYLMVACVLSTGARVGTLRFVRLEDIDFTTKTILFSHLKNKNTFHAPMSPQLEKEIKHFVNLWDRSKTDGYLFCEQNENQPTYSSLRLAFERYCANRGVECKGIHALRHTFATNYIRNGGSLPYLSRLLTHSSFAITYRYVHIFDSELGKDLDKLSVLDRLTSGHVRRRL